MRLLVLVSLTALVGGCSLYGDCSFPAPATFHAQVHLDAAPAPDTLTVLFVTDGYEGMVATHALAPIASPDGALRLGVETRDATGPRTVPRFEAVARGDTVFVRRSLVREACSPPEGVSHRVVRIEAPAGVRAVRVRTVGADEVPFPASAALTRPARPFLTV